MKYKYLMLLSAFLYAFYLHWSSLNGYFLSDTYSYFDKCYNWQRNGELLTSLLAYFNKGLLAGSSDMYRPLGLVSFCSDYVLFNNSAFILKLIQFGLHLLNTVLLLFLVKNIFSNNPQSGIMAIFAAILFLFSPVSPEVSMWISGRFDSLVNLFMILSCLFFWQRKIKLTVVMFCLALLSKESAVVIPAMLFTMSWLRTGITPLNFKTKMIAAIKETGLIWLILILYFIFRSILFGESFQVYELNGSLISNFIDNIKAFPAVFAQLILGSWYHSQHSYWFWILFYFSLSFSAWVAYKNKSINIWLMIFLWLVINILALISQIGSIDHAGTGARVLYNVSMWWAIILAYPLLYIKRSYYALLLLNLAFIVYIQSFAIKQWSTASIISKGLIQSMQQIEPTIDTNQWSMVLIPENIGIAVMGRNAQGGFVLPPFQLSRLLDSIVPFIGMDLELWRQRINADFVKEFKVNTSNPEQFPSKYFCTVENGSVVEVMIRPSDLTSKAQWLARWDTAKSELKCIY